MMFCVPFFNKVANEPNWYVETMESILRRCFEEATGEAAGVGHYDFWKTSTGRAGGLNSKAVSVVCKELKSALQRSSNLGGDV